MFVQPVRCEHHNQLLVNEFTAKLNTAIINYAWTNPPCPRNGEEMIDHVQREVTDVVIAVAKEKSHMTRSEIMDLLVKVGYLYSVTLEVTPFLMLK
ncbi:hypothetical protein [Rufibacter soli]